uniref:Uncharacterized protein n=1 Tax=Erpetoichthys calabaricus TaxID=27687 RepID=A0A8C4SL67_ERPCA
MPLFNNINRSPFSRPVSEKACCCGVCDCCLACAELCDCKMPSLRSCLNGLCPRSPDCTDCCPVCDCACTFQSPDCENCNCLCFEIKMK